MRQSIGFKISCLFLSLSQVLNAAFVDSTWVTTSDPDLNTSTNWSPPTVPTGQATFDSTISGIVLSPTANALFQLESFFFSNSASAFAFTFTGPGALVFTGNGLTGTNTNTTVNATNNTTMTTPQIAFYKDPTSASTLASLGSALFSVINNDTINGNTFSINFAQIVLADIESSSGHLPVAVGNDAALIAANYGTIDATGSEEGAQIFLKGDSFGIGTPANNVLVAASNLGTLEAAGNCGQLLIDAGAEENTFTLGNAPVFTLINDASIISSIRNNAGQLITDGFDGAVDFVVGNNAVFTLINRNGAFISNPTLTGNDAGQILFDGNDGQATLTCGDNAIFSLSNQTASAIQGLGFDSAQMVFDGDGGIAAFVSGKNTGITLTNDQNAQIQSGTDGHDAAQLLVDGNFGSASFTVGDNSVINVTNNGSISIANNVPGLVVGQIVFDGQLADPAGSVFLTTGNNVIITATNGPSGTIDNSGGITPPAQFYFSSAAINGDPTLTAINQGSNTIKGIVFEGSSTADHTNIALQNASLVVNTITPLTIASLQGDATSTGELSQSLNIALRNGTDTTFAGVIKDTLGANSLTISGVGTQVLTGHNTYAGGTTVNSGNLVVDGSIINNVLVTGGQLSGTGTIGTSSPLSTTIVTGGAVKPGDSPGILTNLGNYIQSGGTLKIDLNGLGNVPGVNNGELIVGGSTTLSEPAFVTVDSLDGSFYIGGRYTILASEGPVNGIFNPVVVTNTQIIPVITYDSNDVYLSFQEPFLGCACDSSGRHVAEQLFTITNPNAEEQVLLSAITSLSCQDIGVALDALSGAPYAEQLIGTEIATHQFVRRLYDPLRAFLYKDPESSECECDKGIETWLEIGGRHSNFKPKHHRCSNKLRTNGYQISAGAHTECDHLWAAGAALSYEYTTSKFHHKSSASTKSVLGALYGTYRMCKYYLMGDLVIGGNTATVNRHFEIGNVKFFQKGRPEALQGTLYGEFGYDIRYCSLLVQPFLGLEGGCFNYKRFSEHSDNIACLKFKKKNYGTCDTRLGVHLSMDEIACGLFIGIDLAWQCRFTELKNSLNAEFAKFGSGFALRQSKLDRNSFEAALNLEQKIGDSWSIYATGFWQQWKSNSYVYDILGGISYSW